MMNAVIHGAIKGAWSYFSVSFDGSSHQRYKFKISVEWIKPFGCWKVFCILQLPICYRVSLIIITTTRHIFNKFFQTEHFSALKFYIVYEKNMNFLVIPKFPKVWKKVEKIALGSFNYVQKLSNANDEIGWC